jgi:hypothetical protein
LAGKRGSLEGVRERGVYAYAKSVFLPECALYCTKVAFLGKQGVKGFLPGRFAASRTLVPLKEHHGRCIQNFGSPASRTLVPLKEHHGLACAHHFLNTGSCRQNFLPACRENAAFSDPKPSTIIPIPYTLISEHYNLIPKPYTLISEHYTLIPKPYTLIPVPYTLHPKPYTLIPEHYTLGPKLEDPYTKTFNPVP